jgi:hypothetical protein
VTISGFVSVLVPLSSVHGEQIDSVQQEMFLCQVSRSTVRVVKLDVFMGSTVQRTLPALRLAVS